MKVRTRFVLAFAYILLTVILALTIPLAVSLRGRTTAEVVQQARVSALTIAAGIGAEGLVGNTKLLQQQAQLYAEQLDGRVTIMDETGVVVADAEAAGTSLFGAGGQAIGQNYDTSGRPEVGTALGGQPFAEIRPSEELGHDLLAAAAPIIDESNGGRLGVRGVVRITQDVQHVTDSVRRVTIGVVVVGAAGLLAGLIIAFVLAGSLAKPLTSLADAAHRLGHGELTSRAGTVEGASEVRDLAASFDEMASRLEHTVQAQREFIANASHQLRTPLTGMKLRIEAARADAPDDAMRQQLDAADREVDRLSEIVDRLLTMAREVEEGRPTHVDLGDVATRAVDRWRDRATQAEATLEASGERTTAQGNPTDLDQVVDNLIDNAISYAPGPIRIHTDAVNGRSLLTVTDAGPGIPSEEQQRVTERFYRGKGTPAGGSGLGLAIARQLVEKWGGSLLVADAEGGGTRVEVRLRSAATDGSKDFP